MKNVLFVLLVLSLVVGLYAGEVKNPTLYSKSTYYGLYKPTGRENTKTIANMLYDNSDTADATLRTLAIGTGMVYDTDITECTSVSAQLTPSVGFMQLVSQGASGDTITNVDTSSAVNGQIVIFLGTDDTKWVGIDNNADSGTVLSSGFRLGSGDVLKLIFNENTGLWYEVSRSDN